MTNNKKINSDMTKNVLLKQFTYPNMICLPLP